VLLFFGTAREFIYPSIQMIPQSVEIQVFFGLYIKRGIYSIFCILLHFIFFFCSIISLLPGNIYIYLTLKTETIDRTKRYPLFSIFSVIAAVSLVLFIFLIWRSYIERRRDNFIGIHKTKKVTLADIGQTLKISGRLLKTRNMLLLLLLFIYLGKSSYKF